MTTTTQSVARLKQLMSELDQAQADRLDDETAVLRVLAMLERETSYAVRAEGAALRQGGATLTDIGRAMGVTKQAAQQRFGQ